MELKQTQDTLQQYITIHTAIKNREYELRMKFIQAVDEGKDLPVKWLGVLSDRAALQLHGDESCIIMADYIRDPSFYPFKVEMVADGSFSTVVDEQNFKFKALMEAYGPVVATDVLRAIRELSDYGNGSGRYPILVPWDHDRGKMMDSEALAMYFIERYEKYKQI